MSSKRAAANMYKGVYSNILPNTRISTTDIKIRSQKLERSLKGVSHHRRIAILFLIAKEEGITLDQITQALEGNFKTMSDHTLKLSQAGLIEKKHVGLCVTHSLTDRGRTLCNFLLSF